MSVKNPGIKELIIRRGDGHEIVIKYERDEHGFLDLKTVSLNGVPPKTSQDTETDIIRATTKMFAALMAALMAVAEGNES